MPIWPGDDSDVADSSATPALVFVDLKMPGMDGFEFLKLYDALEELDDVQGIVGTMVAAVTAADPRHPQADPRNVYLVGQNTSRLLLAAGDLITGWLLVRQSEVALGALSAEVSEKDRYFYEGKLAATRFFCTQVLPRLTSERAIVEQTDNALMEVPEAAF